MRQPRLRRPRGRAEGLAIASVAQSGARCPGGAALTEITIVESYFFFSSRRRHTRFDCDWSSDVCSSDLLALSRNVADECLIELDAAVFIAARAHAELHANVGAILPFPGGFQLIVDPIGIRIPFDEPATPARIGVYVACHVQREQLRR